MYHPPSDYTHGRRFTHGRRSHEYPMMSHSSHAYQRSSRYKRDHVAMHMHMHMHSHNWNANAVGKEMSFAPYQKNNNHGPRRHSFASTNKPRRPAHKGAGSGSHSKVKGSASSGNGTNVDPKALRERRANAKSDQNQSVGMHPQQQQKQQQQQQQQLKHYCQCRIYGRKVDWDGHKSAVLSHHPAAVEQQKQQQQQQQQKQQQQQAHRQKKGTNKRLPGLGKQANPSSKSVGSGIGISSKGIVHPRAHAQAKQTQSQVRQRPKIETAASKASTSSKPRWSEIIGKKSPSSAAGTHATGLGDFKSSSLSEDRKPKKDSASFWKGYDKKKLNGAA